MNSSSGKKYLIVILIMAVAMTILVSLNQKKRISWEESYSRQDKIPYGTYVLYERIPDLFEGRIPLEIVENPYSYFIYNEIDMYSWEDEEDSAFFSPALGMIEEASYVFLNRYFDPDPESIEVLLDFVSHGNQVFIAAESMNPLLEDSLGIRIHSVYWGEAGTQDSLPAYILSPQELGKTPLSFKGSGLQGYFGLEDSSQTHILAVNEQGKANFVRIPYGKGNFFLCAVPLAFTNYHLLDSSHMKVFVSAALSHLPKGNEVLWDEYYKEGNMRRKKLEVHPLQFIYSQPPLKWAFLLAVISMFIFILFESKRKRPLIPEKDPFPNTSLEFIETIGRLYFQKGNHKNLLEKKIRVILSEIYHRYGIPNDSLDEDFLQQLKQRTGLSQDILTEGVLTIQKIRSSQSIGDRSFEEWYGELESFSSQVLN